LYLYQNDDGVPHYVKDFYVTLGKRGVGKTKEGDKLSPEGVYFVTSALPKEKLTDFYGPIAFPISYPNEWDRRLGRDGHGIWLHGTPSDTYSRPPRASDGCVVLTNPDITTLSHSIQAGLTPVVISDQVQWVDESTWKRDRTDLQLSFDNWLKDWSSRNTDRYLSHYSSQFEADGQNLKAWGEQKRQVNASKQWIEVKAARVSMFGYPGKDEMAVITFDQNYRSNNLNNQMRKRQYWKREDGEWKIVYEGAA
ncbi:MAG: L,D-transpeptidase family protein, partial [Sulfuricellaceae bacterium]|nr:L,D-transpeptidase family protein [Sulfuricellaceae bacterium]